MLQGTRLYATSVLEALVEVSLLLLGENATVCSTVAVGGKRAVVLTVRVHHSAGRPQAPGYPPFHIPVPVPSLLPLPIPNVSLLVYQPLPFLSKLLLQA